MSAVSQEQRGSFGEPALNVGIVGLGLIGGSLAKAMHQKQLASVIGLDPDPEVIEKALALGILAQGASFDALEDDRPNLEDQAAFERLAACQIVFVCTPAATVARYVRAVGGFCDGLITDVASVKAPIMEAVDLPCFVGGHPMAGSEKQGFDHARPTLFENAIHVLCLPALSQLPWQQLQTLENLIAGIGATVLIMDAKAHDRAVATVSHLPHVVASALSLLAARGDRGELSRLAAGGFRDITRIASASPKLWAGICMQSHKELLPLLESMGHLLAEFKADLTRQDETALERFFYQAAHYRNTLPADGRGAMAAPSVLTVYIHDKPGELGKVTMLLGKQGINIRNVRIREFRAYEGGCLELLISSSAQATEAAWILKEAGYECD